MLDRIDLSSCCMIIAYSGVIIFPEIYLSPPPLHAKSFFLTNILGGGEKIWEILSLFTFSFLTPAFS